MWTRHQMLQTDGTHHETLVTQDEDVGLKIEESDSVWIEEEPDEFQMLVYLMMSYNACNLCL